MQASHHRHARLRVGALTRNPAESRVQSRTGEQQDPGEDTGSLEQSSPELAAFANGDDTLPASMRDRHRRRAPEVTCLALCSQPPIRRLPTARPSLPPRSLHELYLGLRGDTSPRPGLGPWFIPCWRRSWCRENETRPPRHGECAFLALTPNMALGVAPRPVVDVERLRGRYAARNAIFATQLAAEGMTAGRGVRRRQRRVQRGGEFDWPPFAGGAGRSDCRQPDQNIVRLSRPVPGRGGIGRSVAGGSRRYRGDRGDNLPECLLGVR